MKSLISFSLLLSLISSIRQASTTIDLLALDGDDVVIKNEIDDIGLDNGVIQMRMAEVPGYEDWRIAYARVDPEMVFQNVSFIFCEFFVRCRFVKSAPNLMDFAGPEARGARIDFHDEVLVPGETLAGPFTGIRYVVCTQYGTVDGQR